MIIKKTKLKLSDFKGGKLKTPKKKPKWKLSAERRVADWRDFLKDDVDYDYSSILRVLKYKIGRVRNHILEHDLIADAKEMAAEMKEVEDLIEKVMDDKYDQQHVDPVMAKLPLDWDKKARDRAKVSKAHKNAHEAKVADLKKAMTLMSEKIWGWWD